MYSNIFSEFEKTARNYPEFTFAYQPADGGFRSILFGRVLEEVESLAAYLNSLKLGSKTPVAILSENRYEWWVAYLATVALGRIALPMDPQLTSADWSKILKHSEAGVVFCSDQLKTKFPFRTQTIPSLKKIISFGNGKKIPGQLNISHLLKEPKWKNKNPPQKNIQPDDVATLVYTSGTFGNPKGVLLTHKNLLSNSQVMTLGYGNPGEVISTILPLHHMFGFTVGLAGILRATSLILYPEVEQEILSQSFQKLRPHYLIGVPLFFEKIAQGIEARIQKEAPAGIGSWILKQIDEPWGQFSPLNAVLKKTLFRKIHHRLGGRLRFMASGGAALDPHWIRLFHFLGFKFFEGYGLTETSPLVTCNDDRAHRVGSVGKAVAGMQVRIEQPDKKGVGEICAKGLGVMKGYFKDPQATSQAFDSQGWFHTGDLGYLDPDGFLFISGRKREIIVTASGKNVFPKELESLYEKSPFIKEACVFGLAQSKGSKAEAVHVQIVPDGAEGKRKKIKDIKGFIKQEINRLSQKLAPYKHPQSIGFSEDPFPRTTTLKIKKSIVKENYLKDLKRVTPPKTGKKRKEALKTPEGRVLKKLLQALVPEAKNISSESMLQLDLGLDSLSIIELNTALQKYYQIPISESDLIRLQSVGNVIDYLQNHFPQKRKPPREKSFDLSWSRILNGAKPEPAHGNANGIEFPQLPRRVILQLMNSLFTTLWDLQARGLENIPDEGPFILAPNHNSYLDYFFVTCVLPDYIEKQTVVIAETEFFEKKEFLQRMVRLLGHAVFMDPKAVSAGVLQKGAEVLKKGKVLLVYPEGVRSPNGKLQPLKHGVSILANHAQCPIVPVYIQGSHEFWPKGASLPRRSGKITVHFGKPLAPLGQKSAGHPPGRAEAERLTQHLKSRILKMTQLGAPC